MTTTPPILKLAAGAFIIVCGVATATMTGLIPNVGSQDRTAEPIKTETMPSNAAPAAKPLTVKRPPAKPVEVPVEIAAAPVCVDCGVVESVVEIEKKGASTGAGAVIGGVAGLVLGNQIGKGRGKALARVVGAAGGAYAGNQIEKNARKTTEYEVVVRMDDGSYRTITQASTYGLTSGSHVKVNGDTVVLN